MHRDDFRDDLPVSRGQWHAIAAAALELLGLDQPTSRAGATEALVRLKNTRDQSGPDRAAPPVDPIGF